MKFLIQNRKNREKPLSVFAVFFCVFAEIKAEIKPKDSKCPRVLCHKFYVISESMTLSLFLFLTMRNVFAEIKPKDSKCPRVLCHKRKHDYEFVLSSIKAFKGSLFSFERIIHTSDEQMASFKSVYIGIIIIIITVVLKSRHL